jgi:hypothetical protein
MKNRTVYDVLNSVMDNYSYTIEKEGRKVTISGKVYIDRIDMTVSDLVVVYTQGDVNDDYRIENSIKQFKESLKKKVAEVIKSHEEELTDDEAMIDKLLYQVKKLTEELEEAREELAVAHQRIDQLENEKLTQPYQPYYPWTIPNTGPWDNPNPWSTGITWETKIGDPPDWMDKNNITCSTSDGNTSATYGNGDEVIFHTSEYRKKDPKRFG